MAATTPYTIFIFHRDLRLEDNTALAHAASLGHPIIPVFIFTPQQVGSRAPIKSLASIQFMLDSLEELASAIAQRKGRLLFLYGETAAALAGLVEKLDGPLAAIVETRDYTPFAKARQASVSQLAEKLGATHALIDDIYLLPPGTITNAQGRSMQKFTPFYEKARLKRIPHPAALPASAKFKKLVLGEPLASIAARILPRRSPAIQRGGRKEGLALLKHLPQHYDTTHDIPAIPTSSLSAHHHFGTVSIRETFYAAKESTMMTKAARDAFIRQLWWRDFYGNIMNSFEELYDTHPLEFQGKGWGTGGKAFEDWKNARTGKEMVDAGMRQLLETGYMHNRVRLICASYLVKDCGVHWRLGERFFAEHLVDYDITQNMMNWIWVASQLPFASAPFRRHDPDVQAERLDADHAYRERWLGEKKKQHSK